MANSRKNSRRNRRNTMRRNRKNSRRNNMMRRNRRRNNMMGGEYSMPASVNDNSMNDPRTMSLNQGQQYADFHKNQHGGGLTGGPFPGSVTEESLISPDMALSARTAPLNAALNEIRGMTDQAGGKRRRNTMRRNRKNRKASRKNRKNTRKNNMMGGKRRRNNSMRRNRRRNNMMGGMVLNPSSVNAPGLLLSPAQEAKALSGMNAEWKLAENPRAFAPGV